MSEKWAVVSERWAVQFYSEKAERWYTASVHYTFPKPDDERSLRYWRKREPHLRWRLVQGKRLLQIYEPTRLEET